MPPNQLLTIRNNYQRSKQELSQRFLQDLRATDFLEEHSDVVDRLICDVVSPYREKRTFGLFAIGGYGRRELYPGSDIDILLVYRTDGTQSAAEGILRNLIQDLWDTHLDLGHQVWSLEELKELDLNAWEFCLSLLDLRPILASDTMVEQVKEETSAFFRKNSRELANRIVELTLTRHRTFDGTIYQLEPDLKEAPGGLRDYLAATWLRNLYRAEGRYLPYEESKIEEAHHFIQQARIAVHLLSNRKQNRLTHALQEKVAPLLGYASGTASSDVESLMKEYFLNARIINGFCMSLVNAVWGDTDSQLVLEDLRELSSAEEVVQLFLHALEEGKSLSDFLRNAVVDSLPSLSATIKYPALKESLIQLFKPRQGLYRTLSEMYELGILELLFPEFASIKARVIRDFYHRYTVDEHSLLTIRNIEELEAGGKGIDGRFQVILRECDDAYLLTFALLLHDVGKSREGKHSERSARMAARALKRFRLDKGETDTILFLIRNHLAMSSVIQRRDLEEESVIKRFADLVGDTKKLRLLTLLTYADVKAVAPGTLNDWKKDLLWQLYVLTYRKLTLEFGDESISEQDISEKLLSELDPGLERDSFEQFLAGFPLRYLQNTPREEIYEHFRMASRLKGSRPVQTRLLKRRTHYDLCVVTPDRSRLFAAIAGLLSYFEMNILRGYGFSNQQGTILDFFQFADVRGVFRLNNSEKQRFLNLLEQAVLGEVDVDLLLQGKEKSIVFQRNTPGFEPSVYFEDDPAGRYTIVEIIAPDGIGLLYRISREISRKQCDIKLVLISTEGGRAVDVFYLSHDGVKLSAELRTKLRAEILQALAQEQAELI